jgi:hypothetical protein
MAVLSLLEILGAPTEAYNLSAQQLTVVYNLPPELDPSANTLALSSLRSISQLISTCQCRPCFRPLQAPLFNAHGKKPICPDPACYKLLTTSNFFNMCPRPANIGIKAIEIYFPSQVRQNFRDTKGWKLVTLTA